MPRAVALLAEAKMSVATEFWEDYEVLTVETPENLELRLPLAGFGPRFLALLVDSLISGVVMTVLIIIAAVVFGASMAGSAEANPMEAMMTMMIVFFAIYIACTLGYFTGFEWAWNGQTPGKRLAGIRVIRCGGLPLTMREVLLRNLFRVVLDMLPSNGFVGLVSFFASRYQQRLGDLVAGTVVIREFTSATPYPWVGNVEGRAGAGPQGLTPQMRFVTGSYLSRAYALPIEARIEITSALIQRVGYDAGPLSLAEREAYLAQLLDWRPGGTP
jgi:uncharacterized RDD family membrane protein YckC